MVSYFTMSRPEIAALVPPDTKKLLDVGCGAGTFGISIKNKLNCEVWGIEPVPEPAEQAKRVLDKVFVGLFDDSVSQINEKFDVICFNDVLEHMADPWSCLRKAQTLLNEKGIIIASMPNILHYHEFLKILFKRDFKYEEAGIMDKTHLRFFTKKSIVRMFSECGFDVIGVRGLDPTPSKKMSMISLLSFGYLNEMRYPQFAVVAKACKK